MILPELPDLPDFVYRLEGMSDEYYNYFKRESPALVMLVDEARRLVEQQNQNAAQKVIPLSIG
jgi:hypothetical protein